MTSLWSRNLCAAAGGIAGGLSGFVIALLQIMHGSALLLPATEYWRTVLLLTLLAWVIVLVLIGIMLRYGIAPIALPSLFTCFITVVLTVWLVEKIHLPAVAVILGIVIGTVIGLMLCRVFCAEKDQKGVSRA